MKRVVVVDLCGLAVEVRAGEPLAPVLADGLADLALTGHRLRSADPVRLDVTQGDDGRWTLAVEREPYVVCGHADQALDQVLQWLTKAAAAHTVPTDTVVLASAVEHRGRVVALNGRTSTGASSLALWWAGQGARYVSEGLCVLGPDGGVRPFRRPVALRASAAGQLGVEIPDGPFGQVFPHPVSRSEEAPVPESGMVPGPLALFAVLAPGPSGAPAVVRAFDGPGALVHLTRGMIGDRDHRRQMFHRLDALVRAVPVVEVTAYDHRQAHEALVGHLDGL